MKLSIIIPTKDRAEILQRTVDSLIEATSMLDAEIIIVNDSNEKINLKQKSNNIYILNNILHGAASARNAGVKQSSGELLLFLDDDILVSKENLQKTLDMHQNNQGTAYMFFWLYPPDLIEILPQSSFGRYILNHLLFSNSHRIKIKGRRNELIKSNGLSSQYLSILKSDFLQTGGYDERIPFAGEDYVLYKKLKNNGVEVLLSPSDIIFQNESDRISLFAVMERTRRGAMSMRKTQELGHTEMKIFFPQIKKIIYSLLIHVKSIIYYIATKTPNKKITDPIYFKLTNILLGLSQYEGYYINKE